MSDFIEDLYSGGAATRRKEAQAARDDQARSIEKSAQENALDRSLQQYLTEMGLDQQMAQSSAKNALDAFMQDQGFDFQDYLTGIKNQQEKDILGKQQEFTGGQSELDRALQKQMLGSQQEFTGGQSELDRALQQKILEMKQVGEKDILGQQQEFTGGQYALDRDLQRQILSQQGSEAEKGRQFQQRNLDTQQQNYRDVLSRAGVGSSEAEKGFLQATDAPNQALDSYIQQLRQGKDLEQRNLMQNTQAALNTQGVRGGKAANILGRTAGEFQRGVSQDITNLQAQDEAQKRQAKQNFYGNKANISQGALLTR